MALYDQVKALISDLEAVCEDLPTLDDVKAQVQQEKGALEQIKAQKKAEMGSVGAEKAKAERDLYDLQKKIEIAHNDLAKELAAANSAIAAAKGQLADLDGQVSTKKALHDQIEASLESLKKKLA